MEIPGIRTKHCVPEYVQHRYCQPVAVSYTHLAHFTYGELFHEINAQSGGISCGLQVFQGKDQKNDCIRMFGVKTKYLVQKEEFVFSMILSLIHI